MSGNEEAGGTDRPPGESRNEAISGFRAYLVGFALAAGLTVLSFCIALDRSVFWQPGVPAGLIVLAVAQMGIHLVFFLHLTSGPDNTNNALAVAFGVLVIVLVGAGSLWIMSHLNTNMMPAENLMDLRSQH